MARASYLSAVLFFLPLHVFAHGGHVEWPLPVRGEAVEMIEATLVIAAATLYLVVHYAQAARFKHRHKHTKSKRRIHHRQ